MKFKKTDRLLKQSDFAAVFDASHRDFNRRGGVLRTDLYHIYRKPNEHPRLGLSIARRVMKNASDRNRIKRCIKEFFRLHKEVLQGDLVIRLMKAPEDFSYETITRPLLKLIELKKAS